MKAKPHPKQGFRSCLGNIGLGRNYGTARLEAAARRGNTIGAVSYGSIASILKHALHRACRHCDAVSSGTGKTHLAIAFGLLVARRGWKVRFTSAADPVIGLEAAHRQGRMKEFMHGMVAAPKLLII